MAVQAGTAFVRFTGDFSQLKKQAALASTQISHQLGNVKPNAAASAAFKRQGETLRELGRAARYAGAGAALLGGVAVVKTIKVAASFEQQVSRLGAVSNATGKQMAILRRQALAAGAATKFSALDAAEAQTELAKGGLSVTQIMGGGLKSALALAAAGELELADAATFTVNAIKLFGLEGKEAMRVADGLAQAANSTTADVADFGMALSQGGSAAKAAGLSFTETVAALEALAEIGIKNSDAGTSLKTSLAQLAKPTEKQAELTRQLGLDFFDAQGNMLPLVEISGMLQDKLGGLTREQRLQAASTIAGTDGMRTLLALYEAGPEKISRFEREQRKVGVAADVARKKQDNFAGAMENFRGSIETLQISIGSQALPALTSLARRATEVTNVIARISDRKDLDFGEKIAASFKAIDREFGADFRNLEIGENLARAVSFAVPKIAEAAAKAAPRAVQAFFDAWRASNIWGKLVTAGFLLHKFGGFAAFRQIGTRGGQAMGGGIAAGAATTATAQLPGRFGALRGRMSAIGKGVLGVALMSGVADAVTSTNLNLGERFQRAASTATLGILPDVREVDERMRIIQERIRSFRGNKLGLNTGQASTSIIKKSDLGDFDSGQRHMLAGMAKLRTTANQLFGPGTKLLSDAWINPAASAKKLQEVGRGFRMLRNIAFRDLNDIGKISASNFQRIADTMGLKTKEGQQAVTRNFALTATAITSKLAAGKTSTARAMAAISNSLRVHSKGGKDAAARNFAALEGIVRTRMSNAAGLTAKGAKLMRDLIANELKLYGVNPKEALRVSKLGGTRDDSFREAGHARGGVVQFGKAGQAGRDSIPATIGRENVRVAPGEVAAVFNRHQLPVVNDRLRDYGGLPGFFRKNDRPHHMARGGIVGKARDLAGGGFAGMMAAANRLEKAAFPYVWGGGHGGTPAPFGPMDCSGAVSFVLQHGGVKIPTMVSGALASAGKPGAGKVTVFADAGHTFMRLGRRYFGTSGTNPGGGAGFFPDPGDGYKSRFAVRHFDAAGGGGEMGNIPRVVVVGPDSPLKDVVQGGLDTNRAAANIRLGELGGAAIGGGDAGDPGPTGSYSKAQLKKLWVSQGGSVVASNIAASVALAESRGAPDASNVNNNGSIDRGLWQINSIHGSQSTFDPEKNARSAVQISGNGTNWRPWVTYNEGTYRQFLERGGPVGKMADMARALAADPPTAGAAGRSSGRHEDGSFDYSSSKGVRGLLKAVWGKQSAMTPGRDRFPLINLNSTGAGGWAAAYTGGGPAYFSPDWLKSLQGAGRYAGDRNYSLSTIVHEFAHVMQRGKGLQGWEQEGGAEWWMRKHAKEIFGSLGINLGKSGPSGYGGEVAKVKRTRSEDWLERGQFTGPKVKQKRKALGGLVGSVQRTLSRVGRGKTKKSRAAALAPLTEKIKGIGLPKVLEARIAKLTGDVETYGEGGNNAQTLRPEEVEGQPVKEGVFQGLPEQAWVKNELGTLFYLRNALIEAKAIIAKRRVDIAKALAEARKKLAKLAKEGRTPRGWKGANPATGAIATWNRQKDSKRVAKMKEWQAKRGKLPGTREFDKDGGISAAGERQRDAIKKVIPVLTGQSTKLAEGIEPNESAIQAVQGRSGPLTILRNLPALGVLGGQIFTAQERMRDLQAPRTPVTDSAAGTFSAEQEKARGDLLAQLLRDANLRTRVSERQFRVLKDFPPFGGSFATGGVVGGPQGAPRTIIAHGGETVTPPNKGGGPTQVTLIVEDGAVDTRRIRAIANDETQVVIRREARSGARMMPGRPGVLT